MTYLPKLLFSAVRRTKRGTSRLEAHSVAAELHGSRKDAKGPHHIGSIMKSATDWSKTSGDSRQPGTESLGEVLRTHRPRYGGLAGHLDFEQVCLQHA